VPANNNPEMPKIDWKNLFVFIAQNLSPSSVDDWHQYEYEHLRREKVAAKHTPLNLERADGPSLRF